jgi:hypothetical protein
MNCTWKNKELPEEGKESIIVPVRRAMKKIVLIMESFYLSTAYKILSKIVLSGLTSYAGEIIGDHQCGFCRSR